MKKTGLMVVGILLIVLGTFVVLTGTAYTLMLPNMYVSSARILVSEPAPEINPFVDQQNHYPAYNPYFLRTQFEIIQSQPMLYEVINRLNLQERWGREGERLPRNVAYKILKNSISIFQQRDTSLIYISVKRDNPNEAAQIANELAETYRDSRLDLLAKESRESMDGIRAAIKKQQIRVEEAEQAVEKPQVDVESEQFILNQLNTKLREKLIELEIPRNPVEIIDVAEPDMRPVSPNLFMNVLLSLGLATGPMLVGIVLIVLGSTGKSRL